MFSPKISIITPVYNSEKYLSLSINSILSQGYTNYELLLIDDGSQDNSSSICDKYAASDPRIKVWHIKNGGPSRARNLGIEKAKGEYITFVDSDDTIDKDTLSLIIKEMVENNLDLLQYSWDRIDKNNNIINSRTNKKTTTKVLSSEEYIKSYNYAWSIGGNAIKTEVINKSNIRFNPEVKISEDTIFISEIICSSKRIKRIEDTLYHYRDNNASLSYNYTYTDLINSINHMLNLADKYPVFKPAIDANEYVKIVNLINFRDVPYIKIKKLLNRIDISNYSKYSAIAHLFYILSKYNSTFAFLIIRYIVFPLRTIKKEFIIKTTLPKQFINRHHQIPQKPHAE